MAGLFAFSLGELTFVPFQGNWQEADPHDHDKQKDQTEVNPRPAMGPRWNRLLGGGRKPGGFVAFLFSAHCWAG